MMWSSPVLSRKWDIITGEHPSSGKTSAKDIAEADSGLVVAAAVRALIYQSISTDMEEPIQPWQAADSEKSTTLVTLLVLHYTYRST